jgi:hypothetical protein
MSPERNGLPRMKHDWSNINWAALGASKVLIGNAVTFISLAAAITGHALPDSMQSQLTDLLTQGVTFIATVGVLYSSFHRLIAPAESAVTIVPTKTPSTPTT